MFESSEVPQSEGLPGGIIRQNPFGESEADKKSPEQKDKKAEKAPEKPERVTTPEMDKRNMTRAIAYTTLKRLKAASQDTSSLQAAITASIQSEQPGKKAGIDQAQTALLAAIAAGEVAAGGTPNTSAVYRHWAKSTGVETEVVKKRTPPAQTPEPTPEEAAAQSSLPEPLISTTSAPEEPEKTSSSVVQVETPTQAPQDEKAKKRSDLLTKAQKEKPEEFKKYNEEVVKLGPAQTKLKQAQDELDNVYRDQHETNQKFDEVKTKWDTKNEELKRAKAERYTVFRMLRQFPNQDPRYQEFKIKLEIAQEKEARIQGEFDSLDIELKNLIEKQEQLNKEVKDKQAALKNATNELRTIEQRLNFLERELGISEGQLTISIPGQMAAPETTPPAEQTPQA